MTADDVFERRELAKESSENPLKTDLLFWDGLVGPFRRGNLYVLAGYAGVGKTTLAMQLAWAIARQKRKVWFYCLELTPIEVLEVLAGHICADTDLTEENIVLAVCEVMKSGFRFFDSTQMRPWEVHLEIITKAVKEEGIEFVVIDNFHYLTRVTKNQFETEGVVSQRLKGLSQVCNIPILLIHHLRKPESDSSEPEPTIHTMRGTSALLNDASAAVLLHHPLSPEGTEDGARKAVGKLIYGKARWGQGGTRYVRLIGWKRLYESATSDDYGKKRTHRKYD